MYCPAAYPDHGTIKVFGQDVNELTGKGLAEMREKIGFLFQSGALYDSMTVKENLEFPLKRIKKNLTRKEIDEKVAEVLENVGLAETLYKMPSELSGGMRKTGEPGTYNYCRSDDHALRRTDNRT
jgi:phospholipid/cholesterol/gamma-HCH transport system ATP-binding protein